MERSNYTSGSQMYIVQSKAVVHITWIIQTGRYDRTLTTYIKNNLLLPTNIDAQSSGQILQQEMCTSEPTELDALLNNIMKPDTQSQLLEKPESQHHLRGQKTREDGLSQNHM